MRKSCPSSRNATRRDHYQEITDRIIASLETGAPPWRRPWDPDKCGGPAMPRNAVTGHAYRGMNVITLGMSPLAFMSSDPRWATYKQAAERGWQVREGERHTPGIFYKKLTVSDKRDTDGDDDKVRQFRLLRTFRLFHASQIDGIPSYVPPTVAEAPWRAPEAAEIILANSHAEVRIGGERAFYSPGTDHIQMPPRGAFASAGGWASVQLHELGHDADLRIMPRRTLISAVS
jgi:antirestriction protein ArdC